MTYDEKSAESLSDAEAYDLIVKIIEETREHSSLSHGASVRGAIALKEVTLGFAKISGMLNRRSIEKAALATLPHRIVIKPGIESSPEDVIRSITKAVLYDSLLKLPFNKANMINLSKEELQKVLQELLKIDMNLNNNEMGWSPNDVEFALISSRDLNEVFLNTFKHMSNNKLECFKELCKQLEDKGFLEMTASYRYIFTKEAIEELSKALQEKFEGGEVTKEEYERAIVRLEQMLKLGKKKYELPENEIPVLLADIMDVQDKFAPIDDDKLTPIDGNDMYVHYLLKKNRGEEVDSEKTDYRKLQVLIHYLSKQGLVKEIKAGAKGKFILTETAFTWILDDLIKKIYIKNFAKTPAKAHADSEKVDIRKYRPGDVFRDISFRETFRHYLQQQKKLGEIKKSDLKSFVRRFNSRMDIALCIDVSHSMAEQSKIHFAKLAAATLATKATEEGDKIGIVTFSNFGKIIMPLSEQTCSITSSVMPLRAIQYTNIGDGIKCAREMLLKVRDMNQKHIILLTDGEPTATSKAIKNLNMEERIVIGEEYAAEEAKKTVSQDIKISVLFIASGNEEGKKFADKLTKIGGGYLYKINALEDLPISMLKAWQQVKSSAR